MGDAPVTTVTWARQQLPAGPSIFLAGPTIDASDPEPSWREEAISLLTEAGVPNVITPESFMGVRADSYGQQFKWECAARRIATVILFWIPRDVDRLPGFTTNVEFGYDVASHDRKVVLGAPPDCPNPERNRYLIALAEAHSVPVRTTLGSAVGTAVHWMRYGWPL